ncbi:helix-turn-helix domain-containing protein, partial [Ferrovibrio sp.]|uniref:helix-turn-helix domain-containing protein n=1 Tax=Ferrovibrio sp. TaxID=1917215 RepID=UPI00311E464C
LTVTGAAAGGELPDIDTICTAFRLSRRSLARAFQDSLGVGPMTYIRLLRLSQTRRALLAARRHGSSSPGSSSPGGSSQAEGAAAPGVTGIALGHGFTELGRFAQLYRRMFGETPSETLRARH